MDNRDLLSQAWKLIWRFRVMFAFGLFDALVVFFLDSRDLICLNMPIQFILLTLAEAGMTYLAWQAASNHRPDLPELLEAANPAVRRSFVIGLVYSILVMGILFAISMSLAVFYSNQDEAGAPVRFFYLLFFAPFGIAVTFVRDLALRQVIIQRQGVFASLRSIPGLLGHHFGAFSVIYLTLLAFSLLDTYGRDVLSWLASPTAPSSFLDLYAGSALQTLNESPVSKLLEFASTLILAPFTAGYFTLAYLKIVQPVSAALTEHSEIEIVDLPVG
jgi:hypothetical protein